MRRHRDRRDGGHEHSGPPDHAGVDKVVRKRPRKAKRRRGESSRIVFERDQHGADDPRGDGQHAQEQEAAAQKHGRKKAVLPRSGPVANDADEPQKGDAGERNKAERQGDLRGVGGEPPSRRLRIGRNRAPQQSEARQGRQRKSDARDCGGPRGSQSRIGETFGAALSSGDLSNRPNRDCSGLIFGPSRIALSFLRRGWGAIESRKAPGEERVILVSSSHRSHTLPGSPGNLGQSKR